MTTLMCPVEMGDRLMLPDTLDSAGTHKSSSLVPWSTSCLHSTREAVCRYCEASEDMYLKSFLPECRAGGPALRSARV